MGTLRGTVLALNRRRGMAVVEADSGLCSVIGGLNGEDGPEFNDVVSGPLDQPGSQFLYNETRCSWFNAFLRVCGCSFQDAVRETGKS
jgi:hypothetical protein